MAESVSSGKVRRIRALVVKEFYQIFRDPSSIIIAFIFPLILLFIYGQGLSLDMAHLRIGVALEDTSPDAQDFIDSLKSSRFFDVSTAQDHKELVPDLISGKIRGLVVIPSYFSEYRQRQEEPAPILVITDGSEPNTAAFVRNYVNGAWNNWLRQEELIHDTQEPSLVQLAPRIWYNEELNSRYSLIPGSIAIIMTLIGTLLTALVIAREWERGTMEALMTTPVTMGEIVAGKMIPYFCLGMGSMVLCTFVGCCLYGLPLKGSLLVLLCVAALFLCTALALGLLISSFARNQFVASQTATMASFLPAFMLSGFLFEISSMPLPIQLITYLIPARYFVSSLQTLFLVGNVWALLLPNALAMVIFAFLIFLIIRKKMVKRLD